MSNIIDLKRRRFLRAQFKHEEHPRLPWVINEETFIHGCDKCFKCLEACETHIIKRDSEGFPFVDFDENECTFCGYCLDVCPKPLFKTDAKTYMQASQKNIITAEKPWLGNFVINQACLAKNNIYCQSCRDVCQNNAISFDHKNLADSSKTALIATPDINHQACNQCGACVSVCPQDAITFNAENITISGEKNEH